MEALASIGAQCYLCSSHAGPLTFRSWLAGWLGRFPWCGGDAVSPSACGLPLCMASLVCCFCVHPGCLQLTLLIRALTPRSAPGSADPLLIHSCGVLLQNTHCALLLSLLLLQNTQWPWMRR